MAEGLTQLRTHIPASADMLVPEMISYGWVRHGTVWCGTVGFGPVG
jgi:hypothetical protein